jgi:histidine triad (HIT) family protein
MTEVIQWRNPDWYCHGVLDGEIPVEWVFENEQALAFRPPPDHRNDQYATHLLVIPKRHVVTLLELGIADGELLAGLMGAVQGAAHALGLDSDAHGFILRANVLPPYQHTGHIHLHILAGERA